MDRENVLDLALKRSHMRAAPCDACGVRDLSLCSAMEPEHIGKLSSIVSGSEIGPGQALFFEGDPAENLYVIRDGCARIYKLLADGRRMITGFLFPSDIVGLAEGSEYVYGCEAITSLSVCRFPRPKLETLMERFPALERQMLRMATNELAAAQDQMLLLGRKTASEKLASFLYLLSMRTARRGADRRVLSLPMNRSDIGDHLGLTTESVSRCFTQLRRTGLIQVDNARSVTILDHDGLLRMTGVSDPGFEPHSAAI